MMCCTFQCIQSIPIKGLHPPHPLVLLWLAPSQKTFRFELNTLNLGISVLHKTKYPIASGGPYPPDLLLQRSTTVISPPLRNPIFAPDSI